MVVFKRLSLLFHSFARRTLRGGLDLLLIHLLLWASRRCGSAFPPAEIALDGWMEKLIPAHPAVEIEERYRAVLRDNRARDAAAGRTLDGPHLTDFSVHHSPV